VASASPAEIRLVEPTLDDRFFADFPPRLIGDKAYDSDPADEHLLNTFGLDLIPPHKNNRTRPATQDGRALRRYSRRWVVERFFARLHNSRRLVTRWERYVENFEAMLHLACMRILLRAL
jgi:IS5 family transposase